MRNFTKAADQIVNMVRDLAKDVQEVENINDYFTEAYGYLDGDDASDVVWKYIGDLISQ